MNSFSTAELESTEKLAVAICREQYVVGDLDIDEFENRMHAIIGLSGDAERSRVLQTGDVVDITCFGSPRGLRMTTAWTWPS